VTAADPRLTRAREELAAARLLGDGGFPARAVSRGYFAAFYAAEAALLALDETRSELLMARGRTSAADQSPLAVRLSSDSLTIPSRPMCLIGGWVVDRCELTVAPAKAPSNPRHR
jgi:hypothetical protein